MTVGGGKLLTAAVGDAGVKGISTSVSDEVAARSQNPFSRFERQAGLTVGMFYKTVEATRFPRAHTGSKVSGD